MSDMRTRQACRQSLYFFLELEENGNCGREHVTVESPRGDKTMLA